MPAASSSTRRRSAGLALTRSPTCPLVDDRRGARAGRRVREQRLHVARAHVAAIDPELRAAAALDPPRDVDLRPFVVGRGSPAGRVVEGQQHLGHVAGRPAGGARENHLVHFRGAHLPRRVLAHHPAERLDDVRLAAAVRTDDARQARIDVDVGRIDERLETGEAQPCEFHRRPSSLFPPRAPGRSPPGTAPASGRRDISRR